MLERQPLSRPTRPSPSESRPRPSTLVALGSGGSGRRQRRVGLRGHEHGVELDACRRRAAAPPLRARRSHRRRGGGRPADQDRRSLHARTSLRPRWRSDTVGAVGRPQLLVIRHGQTEWSRTGRHTGRTDVPLERPGPRRSTLTRRGRSTVGTSRRVHRARSAVPARPPSSWQPARGVVIDSDLVEWDYGIYEGRTTPEIREEEAGMVGVDAPDEGRRNDRAGRRARRPVPDDGCCVRPDAGNAAVFAHGHVLAILIARWCELAPIEGRRFPPRDRDREPARLASRGPCDPRPQPPRRRRAGPTLRGRDRAVRGLVRYGARRP